MDILLLSLAVAVGFNLAVFLMAYWRETDKLTDFAYAATFIAVVLLALPAGRPNLYSWFLVLMVVIWAMRLGSYLMIRINKAGRDKRFDEMRSSFWKFGRFWLLQGLSVWVLLLPVVLFLSDGIGRLHPLMLLGLSVWLLGLVVESVADLQKYRFMQSGRGQRRWIDTGLWSYSRHPNYFGEILVWAGVYIYTLPALGMIQAAFAAIGPIWIIVLLVFISGLPPLEKKAEERWGDNPDYISYKKRTPALVPFTKTRKQ